MPQPGSPEDSSSSSTSGDRYINVSQFGQLVHSIRDTWEDRSEERYDGGKEKDGLILFAGDVFNPSVESSVTRGSHMVSRVGGEDYETAFRWSGGLWAGLITGARDECPQS